MSTWIKFPITINKISKPDSTLASLGLEQEIVEESRISWMSVKAEHIMGMRPAFDEDGTVRSTMIYLTSGITFIAKTLPSTLEKELGLDIVKMPLTNKPNNGTNS